MIIKRKSLKNDFAGVYTGGVDVTLQTCSESSALLKKSDGVSILRRTHSIRPFLFQVFDPLAPEFSLKF